MNLLRFDRYTFDSVSLELSANGTRVTLRPKTAELLRELITRRDQVVNKRDLVMRIWHTEHVTDQSVFQAVSELRAALAPLKVIRTFPNRGYQWVSPVTETRRHSRTPVAALAASLFVALLAALVFGVSNDEPRAPDSSLAANNVPVAATLPAMLAFSEGAAALQRGDTQQARELLALSVAERPDFVEARLLLAEAFLLGGDALEARRRAGNVVTQISKADDAYATIVAMDLMSRADQQLGQMNSALEWATQAADQANTNGYECTAADLHDRVLALVQEYDYSTERLSSPVFASMFARRLLGTAFARHPAGAAGADTPLAHSPLPTDTEGTSQPLIEGLTNHADANERPSHCARYRDRPSGEILPVRPVTLSLAYLLKSAEHTSS